MRGFEDSRGVEVWEIKEITAEFGLADKLVNAYYELQESLYAK